MARTEVTGSQIKDGTVSLTADVTGILTVANGGTGSDTLALNNVLLGNGTGALQAVAPGTAGNVLTSNGTSWVSSPNAGGGGDVTLDGVQTLTNKTLTSPALTTPVITGIPTGTGVATAGTANTLALRDASGNLAAENFVNVVDSTATAAGTTTLTLASGGTQVFTGTTTQTVRMPTTGVVAGQKWTIINQSTGAVAIQSSTGAAMFSLPAGYAADVTCLFNTPTTALHWRGTLWAQTAGVIPTTSNSLAAFGQSTTNTIGVGTIELGHATDTTLGRSAAGTLAVEGVNVVMTGGALGTPSSGTLTNCTFPTLNQNTTGSAATLTTARTIGGVSFNGSANIDLPGVNTAGTQNTSGTAAGLSSTLAVGSGGTGATTLTGLIKGTGTTAMVAATAGTDYVAPGGALGTPASGTLTNCTFPTLNQNTTGTAANVTGTVAVANGGTGSTTLTLNNVLLGNGTSALQAVAPGTTGNVLTSNGTTWTSAAPTGGGVSRVTSTVTSATTLGAVANTEYLAYIASGGSVTLPTAVGNTSLYTLKNTDTTTKTITTVGDDASFASVTALLRGNGDDASTVFTDSSGKYAWTGNANVRLSTAVKKFGTASIYFGAGGNNAAVFASTLPGMGAGDFTIEMWFYSTVAAPANGYYLYDPRPYTVNGVYTTMYVTSGQKLTLLVSATARITGTTNITTNTWHHAALCRSGGVTRLFLNGVQEGSDYADTNNYLTGAGAYVGNTTAFINGVWAGYVDDVRVTQGVGRYTAGFTAPTTEFPITQLIDGNYPLVLAPNQAIELASSGSNWSVVSDAAPIPALTTTPTSATTTTLTVASTPIQVFTGTTTHTVKLPSTGIVAGRQFTVINNSTGLLTMQTSTAAQIHVLASGTESILTALIDSPTTAAPWEDSFIATNFAAGKALTVNNSLTLAGVDAKTLTVNNSLTLAGTDGTTMTFPGATDTVVTLAAAQTLTNKTLTTPTLTTPVINSTPTGTGVATANTVSTLVLRDASGNFSAGTITATALAARVNPRIGTVASSATPTIDLALHDQYNITALAVAITSIAFTGTPLDGQKLMIRVKDNGTARAIAWSSAFTSSGVAVLPTTTVASKTHLIGLLYDSAAAKWVCVASDSTGY